MLSALLFVAVCLLFALALRRWIGLFAVARIPASLLAGVIGLAYFQILDWGVTESPIADGQGYALSDWLSESAADWTQTMRSWPGVLIAFVFAGLLLTKSDRGQALAASGMEGGTGATERFRRVGREALMVWIIVIGQSTVGLWITWLLIQPTNIDPGGTSLPNSMGMLIETGFAGGHGTAAAMGTVFAHPSIGFPAGLDLGLLMATAGLAWGLVSGMLWINLAIWRGWYQPAKSLESGTLETAERSEGGESLGKARVEGNVVDPLLLQALWLLLALGIGLALQQLVSLGGGQLDTWRGAVQLAEEAGSGESTLQQKLTFAGVLGTFPLFIYTLFGGALLRRFLRSVGQGNLIDPTTISRLVASAMDVLVIAAVATLNLETVQTLWLPFLYLFAGGAIWTTFCLFVLSPRILPKHYWFPLGLLNYGMSTGTTATGFVLLRVIDPNLKSGASEDYALAAPFSAPFIGGGMLTIALPLLVLEYVPLAASTLTLTAVLGGLVLFAIRRPVAR
ncbi:hypothetical protein FF011L_45430 [Roseimaritima multifibrata]|uniref:Sodium/glutamate symporter n=1 Tax=Roseimaritima multifibrata TaxID=1930274 RepID=A0A517MLJ3_9BACT|nr:sodium:glutamate symporter [Roseimaritima multifibrata]QDS95743.1 hypothetical protein FF011L_45430 [Roseimaritima multifibrata]